MSNPGLQVVEQTTELKASAEALYKVVTDYESYPRWLPEFKEARVIKRDGDTVDVEFTFAIPLKKIRYSIRVVHTPAELTTAWTFLGGDIVDDTVGGWRFEKIDDQTTRVHYRAGVSVNVPMSKGIVNRVANLLTGTTLPRTFKNLEERARR
jgi:ribosome-associated toxin RatA of RatAB toxin-antitoxin module